MSKVKSSRNTFLSKNLKKYSKKYKLDLNYFLTGGFWVFLAEFINVLRGFILSILFANYLSKEIYGKYTFIFNLISIAALFALSGMGNVIVTSLSKKFDGTYKKAINSIFTWSFFGSLFLLIYGFYDMYVLKNYSIWLFVIIAILLPFYTSTANYHAALYGKKKLKEIFFLIYFLV